MKSFTKSEFLESLLDCPFDPCELFTYKGEPVVRRVKRFNVDDKIGKTLASLEKAERIAKMAELFTLDDETNEVSPLDLIPAPQFAHLQRHKQTLGKIANRVDSFKGSLGISSQQLDRQER